jgi:hypothetical protein
MEHETELQQKQADRDALLKEAASVVQAVEAQSREPSPEEDALVLVLMTRLRKLEQEIEHLKRRQSQT